MECDRNYKKLWRQLVIYAFCFPLQQHVQLVLSYQVLIFTYMLLQRPQQVSLLSLHQYMYSIYVAAISSKPMEIQKKTTLLKLADYFLLSRSQCKKRFTKHVQRRLLWLYSIYVRVQKIYIFTVYYILFCHVMGKFLFVSMTRFET